MPAFCMTEAVHSVQPPRMALVRPVGTMSFAATGGHLPKEVCRQVVDEFGDWRGSGRSVLELPFTSLQYREWQAGIESDLRCLLTLPDNYRVLFMQGGASAQFSLVPMNLLCGGYAAYADSGYWAKRAIREARRYCEVKVLVPHEAPAPQAAYWHITSNETVEGWQYRAFPDSRVVPLVADMTADFLTRPVDVSRFGLIYASAQKNVGAAGLTIVIVRDDLVGRALPATPSAFDYHVVAQDDSRYNTPPMFAVYVASLVFAWLRDNGGLPAMQTAAMRKSGMLYDAIDASNGFYRCDVGGDARSVVNVCFSVTNEALTGMFLREAQAEGMLDLAGHLHAGGIRASVYNAVPEESVRALAGFMKEFARRRG